MSLKQIIVGTVLAVGVVASVLLGLTMTEKGRVPCMQASLACHPLVYPGWQ